jgi:serpin B
MQECFRPSLWRFVSLWLCLVNSGGHAAAEGPVEMPDDANRFGFRLLSQLIESEPQKRNFVVSPLSLQLALAMTYAGAEGPTATAIANALGWNGATRERLLAAQSGLQNSLSDPGKDVELRIANALWVDESIRLQPEFRRDIKQLFNSEVFSRHFGSPEIVQDINGWVEKQTAGKISELLARPPSPPLLLVDAVYFKAPWWSPFAPHASNAQPFFVKDGPPVEVIMMHKVASFPYLKSDAFEALRLPYAGDRLGLVLFLPGNESSANDLIQRLSERSWSEFQKGFQSAECNLAVPRFKITYDAVLNEPLKRLGMKQPFNPQTADFRRMLADTRPVYIERVFHKTFLRVDEAGSEAAAATSVAIVASVRPALKLINITFDRPFVFAIVDNRTQAILFIGLLGDPNSAKL